MTLIGMIDVPIILLWFSSRKPNFDQLRKLMKLFQEKFPQLVDEKMIKSLNDKIDHTVYCISRNGLPIKFKNEFLNKEGYCHFPNISRSSHSYYPSDNMHSECAELLAPKLKNI